MPIKPPSGVSIHNKSKAQKGFTLLAPIRKPTAYLIDMQGNPVHRWKLGRGGINHAMLLDNGNLFIAQHGDGGPPLMAGKGGLLREYDWDGKVVWEHYDEMQHHDARRLKNGNAIYIAWEPLPKKLHRRVKGGLPGSEAPDGHIYGDVIREVNPSGDVVWEWRSSELKIEDYPIVSLWNREEFAHANTVAPMPNGDLLVSFRVINTIMVIDKKTRKVKWEMRDERFGGQHDCHMLPNRKILVFANGQLTGWEHPHSRIVEIDPKTKKWGWQYRAERGLDFFSPHISGAQRLPNGNTLICEGGHGRLFEVTREGKIVWQFVNPHHSPHPVLGEHNWVFRAYRYTAGSKQIRRRAKQS